MSEIILTSDDRLIPMREVGERWSCRPITVKRACERYGIAIVRISPRKHALTQSDYDLLLSRARDGELK